MSFDLPVTQGANASFREALMQFSAKYHVGGYPISHSGIVGDAHYEITIPTSCEKSEIVLNDIIRGAAPLDRIPEFLTKARASVRCQIEPSGH